MKQFAIAEAVWLGLPMRVIRERDQSQSEAGVEQNQGGSQQDSAFQVRIPRTVDGAIGQANPITAGLQTRLTDAQLKERFDSWKQGEAHSPSHTGSKYSQAEVFGCFGTVTQSRGMAEKQCNADV